jgi:hypothetical protein
MYYVNTVEPQLRKPRSLTKILRVNFLSISFNIHRFNYYTKWQLKFRSRTNIPKLSSVCLSRELSSLKARISC